MNYIKRNQKIWLREFIPEKALTTRNNGRCYDVKILDLGDHYKLSYITDVHNQTGKVSIRKYFSEISKYITRNKETFEVLGLLQAEMGKQSDGKITFCNHEYQLVNKVINWFHKEFNFPKERWKWYIKVNINEPIDLEYRKKIEENVISFWIEKTGVLVEQSYPKKVTYIKNTINKELKYDDYGTLIIERHGNLFSQILKNFVNNLSQNILNFNENEIRGYMKGIIAGESCVEFNKKSGHFRVFISAKKFEERQIYQDCLKRLKISSTNYPNFHGLVISQKQYNLKLLKQRLMTLSPEKYSKFLLMMSHYNHSNGLINPIIIEIPRNKETFINKSQVLS